MFVLMLIKYLSAFDFDAVIGSLCYVLATSMCPYFAIFLWLVLLMRLSCKLYCVVLPESDGFTPAIIVFGSTIAVKWA